MTAPFAVVVDADVLYPFTLRDTLLRGAAAALMAGARVIVTYDLGDFDPLPEGLEALSPDEFLCDLFDRDPDLFVELLRDPAHGLMKPAVSLEDLLGRRGRMVPDLVALVRLRLAAMS